MANIGRAASGIGEGIFSGVALNLQLAEQRKQREELARQFNEQQLENQRQFDTQSRYNQALLEEQQMKEYGEAVASGTAGADLQKQLFDRQKKQQEDFAMLRKYGKSVGARPGEVELPDQVIPAVPPGLTQQGIEGIAPGRMSLPGDQFKAMPFGPASPLPVVEPVGPQDQDQGMRDVLARLGGPAPGGMTRGAQQFEASRTTQWFPTTQEVTGQPALPAPSAPQITTKAPTPLKAEDLDNVRQLKPAHVAALANDSERLELFKRKPTEITGTIGIALQQNMVDPPKLSNVLRKINLGQELTEEDMKGLFREGPLTEEQKLKYAENGQRREAVLWTTLMQNQNNLNEAIKGANIVDDKNVELVGTYQAAKAPIPDKVMAAMHKRTNDARKNVEQNLKSQETIKKQLSEEFGEDFQPAELDVEARTKESLKFFEARKKELIGNMQSEAAARGAALPPAQIEAEAAKQARLEGMERFDVDVAGLREPSPLDLAPPPTEDLDVQFAKFVNEAYAQTKDMTKAMEQAGQRLAAENPTSTDPRVIAFRQGAAAKPSEVPQPKTRAERDATFEQLKAEYKQMLSTIPEDLRPAEKYREKEKILDKLRLKYGDFVDETGIGGIFSFAKGLFK